MLFFIFFLWTFLFHSLQFSSKLPETWHIYVKIRCTDSNHLRFWKFLLEKKLWHQNISSNGNRLKIIFETRQAVWILFVGIELGISRDELPHIWYITMTTYQFLWRHSYFLFFVSFVSQPTVFIETSWNLGYICKNTPHRQ